MIGRAVTNDKCFDFTEKTIQVEHGVDASKAKQSKGNQSHCENDFLCCELKCLEAKCLVKLLVGFLKN